MNNASDSIKFEVPSEPPLVSDHSTGGRKSIPSRFLLSSSETATACVPPPTPNLIKDHINSSTTTNGTFSDSEGDNVEFDLSLISAKLAALSSEYGENVNYEPKMVAADASESNERSLDFERHTTPSSECEEDFESASQLPLFYSDNTGEDVSTVNLRTPSTLYFDPKHSIALIEDAMSTNILALPVDDTESVILEGNGEIPDTPAHIIRPRGRRHTIP